jgi:hypothetical protein
MGLAEDGSSFEAGPDEPLPPFLEASVVVEQNGVRVDRAWVSDGTWIRLDGPMGDCTVRSDRPDGVALAGCGASETGTVLRTLRPSRALAGSLGVHASTDGEVCIESGVAGGFACAPLHVGWNQVPFTQFEGELSALDSADVLTFRSASGGLEVSGLTVSAFGEDEERRAWGCSNLGWSGLGLWLLVPLVARRRGTSGE